MYVGVEKVGGNVMKKKLIITGVVAALVIVFVVAAVKNKPAAQETIGGYKEGPRVQVEYVKKQDIETKISSSGKLEAEESKTLYLDTNNKVKVLHKEVGDMVKAGELIITLDQEAQLEAQNTQASLNKQLEAAQKALSNLKSQGSTGEILAAQTSIETYKNQKSQTEKTISDTKTQIANYNQDLANAQKDLEVSEALLEQGAASQKEVDDLKEKVTTINQSIQQAQQTISLSEASLKTIDLQIKNAQYNLDVLQNKVTDQDKQVQIAAKESEIKELQNRLYTANNTVEKASTQVVAPIDGVITYLPDEEGMSLTAGSQLVTIVDPSVLKVNCNVSTYYAADLRTDLDAIIKYTGSKTVEVPGKVSKVSKIAKVEKTTNGEATSLPVEVKVAEPGDIIRPGFTVDVKIITDTREDACVVPILAIIEEEDLSYVYVVGEDGTLEKREITQGLSDGLYIEAIDGLQEGEMIVSSVEDYLSEGLQVSYEKIGDNE